MSQQDMFDDYEDAEAVERVTLTEDDLFKRLTKLETDKLVLAADISQLKKDATYEEDENPKGINKDVIKLIAKAAQLHAKRDFEEKKFAAAAVFAKYEELTGYNS
jgi:hypothetical protein